MGFSTYGANAVSNAIGNNTSFAVTQSYIKLHTAAPGAEGTVAAATEATRKPISVGASSAGVCTSDALIEWTSVAGSEQYTHISIWDASTNGNCLGTGALTAPKTVTAGDTAQIQSGSYTWTSTIAGAT